MTLPNPDLQILSATAPGSGSVGSSLSLYWTVKNSGAASALAGWFDAIYLSSDDIIDSNDTFIGAFSAANLAALSAGGTYTISEAISVPSVSKAGRYYLIIETDSFSSQAELSETNNSVALPINLDLNGPDLEILTAATAAEANVGSRLELSWTVKNSGADTGSLDWFDAIYLSTDTIYDDGDIFIRSFSAAESSPLAVGSSYTLTKTISVPNISKAGRYYLIIKVDSFSSQGELSETNNSYALPIKLDLIGPDLQLVSATAPATASVGGELDLSWTIKNIGSASANADWWDLIYLSSDTSFDDNDTIIGSVSAADFAPLAPGASYTESATFSVPSISSAGQYYLIIETDITDNQGELNEINNGTALAIKLDLNAPDLQIEAASAPSSASVGGSFNLSWSVKNRGVAAANGNWWDVIYLSSDATYDSNDTLIASFSGEVFAGLEAAEIYTLSKDIIAPSINTAGKYYLIIKTDGFSNQGELSETNNSIVLPIQLDLNGPDLQLLSATAPAAASIGSALPLSWTVQNVGAAAANADWWDAIYLSSDASYDNTDLVVGSFSAASDSPLLSGDRYSLSTTVSVPNISTAGQYYLIIRADRFNNQAEVSETNNSLVLAIDLDRNGPDLQVLSATAPATASVGAALNLSWTVKNGGTASANAQWWDVVYLSADANYDYSDIIISFESAAGQAPLAPGASYTFTVSSSVPGVSTAGQYYLIFAADSFATQGEVSETNNNMVVPIYLDLNGPDLQLLSVAAPTAVSVDNAFSISWTVRNSGAASANTNWLDAIYLSKDNVHDANDVLIGYFSNPAISPLASGNSYTASETISVPSDSPAGQYFLIVQTDSFTHQHELSEINNSVTLPITVVNNAPDPPTVTVSVDPQQGISEDGTAKLIYTLTRSGSTSSALTVFFAIDERPNNAAVYNVDFKQSTATAKSSQHSQSISFLPGSSTATLILEPIRDDVIEPDETIYFQLVPDKSYVIGTPGDVLGRILNDDSNPYTPGPTTLKGVNLGSTSQGYALVTGNAPPISVTFAGGKASPSNPGSGWGAVAAAPSASGFTFYWRNSGSGQTARWDLNSGGAYTGGTMLSASQLLSEEASLNFDLDGDGITAGPTTLQGVNLGSNNQGYALLRDSGAPIQVTWAAGIASASNPGNGWNAVAAAPSASGYTLYWRNSGSDQTARWDLNSSGAYTGGSLLSPSQLLSEEASLSFDLNGDGATAGPRTILGVNLGSTSQGYALVTGNAPPLQVTYPGGKASASNPGNGWDAVAAAASGQGYVIYWRNSGSAQTARWDLNNSGAYTGGTLLSASQLLSEEASLNLDINGDGYTGGPTSINGLNLGSTSQGYALVTGNAPPIPVTYPGGHASPSNPGNGWSAVAAAPSAAGYAIFWRNSGTGQTARWDLNSAGAYQSGAMLSASQLISEEVAINADLNGDSIIGSGTTAIENQGNASLLRQRDGMAAVQVGSTLTPVSSPFGLGIGDSSSEWQMLAAETIAGQNQILWRNNLGNFYHLWNLNSSWAWQSSYGSINPSSAAALGLESSFQVDLNGNGIIGTGGIG